MRTTLTLEPDVAAEVERIKREEVRSLKAIINELLRLGARERRRETSRRKKPFKTRTVSLGAPRIPIDNVADALAIAEGDDYR
ncbi:MAG TPA: hypothetical protein VEY33_09035 [Gemmatimonadota bacterium]|nr:hypothetical protein [Gemmatimonadota bacterium]